MGNFNAWGKCVLALARLLPLFDVADVRTEFSQDVNIAIRRS